MKHADFSLDERLGIALPNFTVPYEEMSPDRQAAVIEQWETIRARIPDQIQYFENEIQDRLTRIHETEDWDQIVAYFHDISDIASRIAELNTWSRVDPVLSS